MPSLRQRSSPEPGQDHAPVASTSNLKKHRPLRSNPLPTTSFNTLKREHEFRYPSKTSPAYPEAHKLIEPHIKSFDALFEEQDGTLGLLSLAVKDLDPHVIFDGKGPEGSRGNKLTSKF